MALYAASTYVLTYVYIKGRLGGDKRGGFAYSLATGAEGWDSGGLVVISSKLKRW